MRNLKQLDETTKSAIRGWGNDVVRLIREFDELFGRYGAAAHIETEDHGVNVIGLRDAIRNYRGYHEGERVQTHDGR